MYTFIYFTLLVFKLRQKTIFMKRDGGTILKFVLGKTFKNIRIFLYFTHCNVAWEKTSNAYAGTFLTIKCVQIVLFEIYLAIDDVFLPSIVAIVK